jgi:two-component system, NtrC family, response regulator AtoC
MSRATILVVDDDAAIRLALTDRLESEGCDVLEAETGRGALDQLANGIDLVILDDHLPDGDGVSILRQINGADPDLPVIGLTACATVDPAVEAMRLRAHDFAHKPLNLDELAAAVERALETSRLRRAVRQFQSDAARPYSLQRIVGSSPAMVALRHLVARVAVGPASTILLTGESGTGKDLVARIVHYISDRATKPFMSITCSALPERLLESELFGHERGAFTSARARKMGLLDMADGGTVFLDDIGELALALQAKLLRVLEEKNYDVRVVAATNRNLQEDVAAHRFRADLFFRLNALPISMPSLRSHADDVPLLAEYFIDAFNQELRKGVLGATSGAYRLLQAYGWPGNVRELRNVIERAMLLSDRDRLDQRDFPLLSTSLGGAAQFELPPGGVDLETLERGLLVQALRRCGGNQTRAGSLLGLNRDQIRYRIEKFGLTAVR